MTDLAPLTALGGRAPRRALHGGIVLAERPDIGLALLAQLGDSAPPGAFGLSLPGPGGLDLGAGLAALWMAPGQWLFLAEGRAEENLAASLAAETPGHAVTEQTDAWAVFEIEAAPQAIAGLLGRLVNLDPLTLAPGRGTRTLLHHLSVLVLRPAPGTLRIATARSFAAALWHVLDVAARRAGSE